MPSRIIFSSTFLFLASTTLLCIIITQVEPEPIVAIVALFLSGFIANLGFAIVYYLIASNLHRRRKQRLSSQKFQNRLPASTLSTSQIKDKNENKAIFRKGFYIGILLGIIAMLLLVAQYYWDIV